VLVAGHYQPLADNVAVAATSDQTCLPQSTRKAKRRWLARNQLRFDPERDRNRGGIEAAAPSCLYNPEVIGLRPGFPFRSASRAPYCVRKFPRVAAV